MASDDWDRRSIDPTRSPTALYGEDLPDDEREVHIRAGEADHQRSRINGSLGLALADITFLLRRLDDARRPRFRVECAPEGFGDPESLLGTRSYWEK